MPLCSARFVHRTHFRSTASHACPLTKQAVFPRCLRGSRSYRRAQDSTRLVSEWQGQMPAQVWGAHVSPSALVALPKLRGQPADGQHPEASETPSTVVQGMVQGRGGRVRVSRTLLFREVTAPRKRAKCHGQWPSRTAQQLPLDSPKSRGGWHVGPDRGPAGWAAQALLSRPRPAQSARHGTLNTCMTDRWLRCSGHFLPCIKNTVNSGKAIQVGPAAWNLRRAEKAPAAQSHRGSPTAPPEPTSRPRPLWRHAPTPTDVPERLLPASACVFH